VAEETGVLGENLSQVTDKLDHDNGVSSTSRHERGSNSQS